jgi:hypothetical protein
MSEMLGSNGRLLGTRRGRADRTGRLRKMRRNFLLERLEDRQLLSADIMVSLTGNEILLSGDTSVTSLDVVYDPVSEIYALTANSGVTFGTDGSLPSSVLFTESANSAAIAPDIGDGDTWASLGYYVGTDMTTTTGTAITLGGTGAPESDFGTPFDVANSSGGTTDLTIDDADDTSAQTVAVTDSSLTIGSSPANTYGSGILTGLTFDTSDLGGTTVDVTGSPAATSGLAPITLAMGAGGTNTVNLGDPSDAAADLGDVTITSAGSVNDLTIDDSADSTGQTIGMTATTVVFNAGPTFDYSSADLAGLTLDGGTAANTVNVTGTPAGITPTLAMGASTSNAVNLGNVSTAASTLGNITVTGTTGLTIDDAVDATARTVAVTGSSLSIGVGPVFDYSGATLQGLTFDASNLDATTVDVTGTSVGTTLAMGTSTSNVVNLGNISTAANSLGNVTVTGTTALTVDDAADASAPTVEVTSSSLSIVAGPVFGYSGAAIQDLTFDGGSGANTVNVTSTNATSTTLAMGSSPDNAVNLGDGTHAASHLGNVTITGTNALTVDDSADATAQTVGVTGTSLTIGTGPVFTYSGATIEGLTFDGGTGANTVDVTGTPTGSATTLAMGSSTSNAVNLGDASTAASNLGDVTVTGPTDLTIDDAADATGQTVAVTSSTLAIGAAPVFDYGGATLSGLTFDAANAGSNTVNVTGTPTATNPLTLAMGTGTGNSVDFGPRADAYGNVTLTTGTGGTTGLTINDAVGNGSWVYGVTASAASITGGPTLNYSGATLSSLELDLNNNGSNTVDVTGTPTLPVGSPLIISAFSGGTNTLNLGDATHAASGLGSISIGSGSSAPYDLTIDDAADTASSATLGISSSQFSFAGGPAFDLSQATLDSLTFDASDQGSNTVNVTGSPAASPSPSLAPITLAMGTGTGNAVNLGDATHAAGGLGNVTVTTSTAGIPPVSGSTSLTIDDSDDATAQDVDVTATSTSISDAPVFTYGGADLTTLTFDASVSSPAGIDVSSTPGSTTMLNLQMGMAANNSINLGDADGAAFDLGDVTVTTVTGGMTGLWISDSVDESGQTIGVSATAVSFDNGPTFDYSGANLSIVSLTASEAGGNVVTVTGTPAATNPLSLDMGTAGNNAIKLGDATHAASSLGSINILTDTGGSTSLTVDDASDTSAQTVGIDATSLSFDNGPGFVYNTSDLAGLTFDSSSAGSNDITVTGSPQLIADATVIDVSAPQDNPDAVTVGNAIDPAAGLAGNVNVQGSGYASLTIEDSGSTVAGAYFLQSNQFAFGAAPGVGFGGLTNLTSLTLKGSSGGDTWDVTGSPTSAITTIDANPGVGKTDSVSLGDGSHPASGLGAIVVKGDLAGKTELTIDDSADTSSTSPVLEYNDTTDLSDLTDLAPSTISFNPTSVTDVSLEPGSGSSNTLTVDFSQGNPLPAGASSSFNYEGTLGADNALVLQGEMPGPTPFDSETYAPTMGNTGAGMITLTTGGLTSTLNFGNLTPITDTVPVTSYTFTAPSNAHVVNITTGPDVGPLVTDQISSGDDPSAFELVDFANKTDVLVDLSNVTNPTYIQPPATKATGLVNLTFKYFGPDTSGQTLTVNGTTPGTTNTIQLGGNGNTVLVENVTATGPLVIDDTPGSQGGPNTVDIGDNGSLANISAGITIEGGTDSTKVNVDGSAETTPFPNMLLETSAGMADLTGVLPGGTLSYDPNALNSITLSTGTGADHLEVDFINGNPFFGSAIGAVPLSLSFNGGGGGDSLGFQDSSGSTTPIFNTETYDATGPGSGIVAFYDGATPSFQGGVQFSNLTPTIDSTPVTNYTFMAPASGGTITVTDDSTAGYTLISDPSASPSFESVAYSNKTNVTIDASAVTPNNVFVLDNPTAATGQVTSTVKLGSGSDTVNVEANPAAVTTTINGGVGSDLVTVAGAGLAAGTTASNFSILGGTGVNSLRINSQATGSTATLTPSTLTDPASASFATDTGFAFTNMSTITDFATNHAPAILIPSPLPTISAQSGLPLVDVPVATFTDADLIENVGSYLATINWGDSTAPTTGTITADPSTPGKYIISGSHMYQGTGSDPITVTLMDLGGTFNSTLVNSGGVTVPVTTQLDTIAALSGNTADASVADLQVLTTSPVTGTAGTPVVAVLATFSNTNGSTDPSDYSAEVNWGDGTGLTGATFTYSGSFSLSGTHVYAAPGTYLGTIELHSLATGQSVSIPLSATVQAPTVQVTTGLTGMENTPTGDWTVATVSVPFFLGSPGLDYHGYSASVDYGDGSPTVPATLSLASIPGATAFDVRTSGHVYATPGTYTLSVAIRDGAGIIVGTDSATVNITDPPPPTPTITSGRLSPQSDSGVSDSDGITNVTTPTFVGNSTAGAVIQVLETPTGSSASPVMIATGVANNAGNWSATVVNTPMADGSYQITAVATSSGGSTTASLGTIVIDTVAPVITNIVFSRLGGEMEVFYQDNLSGVNLTDLANGANYQLSAKPLNNSIPVKKVIIPTSISVNPATSANGIDEATILFNHGKPLRGGHYTIQILAAGITDIAGNSLDGRFYGSFPSGNGGSGNNFVAQITAFPRRVLGPFPIQAGYAKPSASVSNRSAARIEAVAKPRVINVVQSHGAANSSQSPTRLLDEAIAALVSTKTKRHHRR